MSLVLGGNCSIYFSEKQEGDMLFKSGVPKVNARVRKNREAFFKKYGILPERLVNSAGVHGNKIHIVKEADLSRGALEEGTRIKNADGLITNVPKSYLMITGADCFPLLFFESEKSVIGALHAGWRGINRNIIAVAFKTLNKKFGGKPQKTSWWIGPGIKKCHFEIKSDVKSLLEKRYSNFIFTKGGKFYADLPSIIVYELITRGVKQKNIIEYPDCTYCREEKWFSYRRDKPPAVKATAFIIGLS